MDFHFKLILFVDKDGVNQKMYASEFLKYKNSSSEIKLDKDNSTIELFYNGTSYISSNWNLGRPDWLLPQIENALNKLENHHLVLVRSAVIEGSELPYMVLEPNEKSVKISLIVFDDYEIEQIFPAGPFSQKSKELYDYFFNYRDRFFNDLDSTIQNNPDLTDYFKNIEVPADKLINDLETMIKELTEIISL